MPGGQSYNTVSSGSMSQVGSVPAIVYLNSQVRWSAPSPTSIQRTRILKGSGHPTGEALDL